MDTDKQRRRHLLLELLIMLLRGLFIALIVLAVRHGWFGWLEPRLAAAGRMALTNYLAHTVIGVTLFYGYGFGFYGTFSRMALLGVTVGVWVLQLAWSP